MCVCVCVWCVCVCVVCVCVCVLCVCVCVCVYILSGDGKRNDIDKYRSTPAATAVSVLNNFCTAYHYTKQSQHKHCWQRPEV